MKKELKAMIFIFCVMVAMVIGGCSFSVDDTCVEVKFSNFTGTKEKEFNLDVYDNELNMSGTVALGAGSVSLSIVAKDSGDELYSLVIKPADSGDVKIDVDLNDQRNLIFRLTGEAAKDFTLKLNSVQKLVLDVVTPEVPARSEKSLRASKTTN